MIANYRRVTSEELEALLRDPSSLQSFLYPEEDEEYENVRDDERHLDIDKAWHGIHYLITGDPWEGEPPLANAVLGGTELSDEDVGYGPARYLTQEEVRDVAAALEDISPDELRTRFDPAELERANIYPNIWQRDGEEALEYVLEYYGEVRRFFCAASEMGDGMLLYLN